MDNKQLYEKQSNQYNPFFPIVRLEDIIDKITEKSIQWILNNYNHIYVEYSESREITRNKVPQILRRSGLWISYNNGKKNITEYYIGENTDVNNYVKWTLDDNWKEFDELIIQDKSITYQHLSDALKQLVAGGNTITNFPDEEDITTDGTVLSFKDRDYEPNNFSGLGRKILRKNIVNGVNILTQEMMSDANTIYVIQYDFTLGEDITIPDNCVLKFDGGSIAGEHTLTGNKTDILAPIEKIFNGVDIQGTWIVKDIYVEWMKINDYDSVNSEVQSILRLQNDTIYQNVYFPNTTLKFTPLVNDSTLCIIASNTHVVVPSTIYVNTNSFPQCRLFYADTKKNITIDGGGTLIGDVDTHECVTISGWTHEYGHGINIMMCNNVTIKNLTCTKFAGDGISIGGRSETAVGNYDRGSNNIFIENVACTYNGRQGMSVIHGKNYRVLNCVFSNTGNANTAPLGPWCGVDLEPNHASQGLEDFVFEHCQFQNNGNHGIRLYAGELCNNIQIISCELSTEQGNDYEGEYLIVKRKCGIAQEGNVTNLVVRDSKCHLFEINSRNNEVNIYNSEIYGFFHFKSEPDVKGNTVNLYGCTIKSGKTTMPFNTSSIDTPVFVRCHCVLNFYDCIIDYSQYDPSRGNIGVNSAQTLVCNFYNSKGNIFGRNNEIVNSVVNSLNTTYFYPIIGVTILLDNVTFTDWKSIQFPSPIMAYPDITTGKAKVIMQNCKFIGSTKAASARDGFIVDYYSRNTDDIIVEIANISSLSVPFNYHCAKFILENKNSKIKEGTIFINEDNSPVWWNGIAFVNSKGQTFGKTYGTTAQRPNLLPKDAGYEYFDNSLEAPKPIFFKDITRGDSVVTQSVSRSSDVFVANTLIEGVAYEILNGNNRSGGFFGFSKVNTSPTEDDLLIIQNTSNSVSDYFIAPDSSLYPFMYFSASRRQDENSIDFYVFKTVQNWVDATGVVAGTSISGTFANKPTVSANSIPVGFRYFCTDKQTTEGTADGIEIIHKGNNVWVDALGRVVE